MNTLNSITAEKPSRPVLTLESLPAEAVSYFHEHKNVCEGFRFVFGSTKSDGRKDIWAVGEQSQKLVDILARHKISLKAFTGILQIQEVYKESIAMDNRLVRLNDAGGIARSTELVQQAVALGSELLMKIMKRPEPDADKTADANAEIPVVASPAPVAPPIVLAFDAKGQKKGEDYATLQGTNERSINYLKDVVSGLSQVEKRSVIKSLFDKVQKDHNCTVVVDFHPDWAVPKTTVTVAQNPLNNG